MSRLVRLSPNAIRAMFSLESDEQLITLLTIAKPSDPTNPLRIADSFTGRLANLTTDEEVIYGVTSNNKDYIFLPLSISLPSEEETGLGKCNVSINYVTKEAIELIRQGLTEPVTVTIDLVLASSPNYVEATFPGFYIVSADYSAENITLNLDTIDYTREPFPCYNFTPNYFPGLF